MTGAMPPYLYHPRIPLDMSGSLYRRRPSLSQAPRGVTIGRRSAAAVCDARDADRRRPGGRVHEVNLASHD